MLACAVSIVLAAAVPAPPLRVVEQITATIAGSTEMTHLVVAAGTHRSELNFPGHISNSPYEDFDDRDRIIANRDQTILAVNLTPNPPLPGGLQICVFQSTPQGIRVIPDFATKVVKLLESRKGLRMFTVHDLARGTVEAWRNQVETKLGVCLRVDGIGGKVDGIKVGNDVLGLRAQPDEVNLAFLQVRLTPSGNLILKSFWHEGE